MVENLYLYKAIVTKVYDGDTIRANIDLGFDIWMFDRSLRLKGIDTPEIRGEERPEGLIARDFVRERIPVGSEVFILSEKFSSGMYGRYLVTVYYGENSTNLNEELLQNGLADVY